MERSKWEMFIDDVEIYAELAWCALMCGLAYSLGKNLVDRLFTR